MELFKIISICKGGGYRYARTDPLHPKANSNGLYPLHRVLMENHLGRLLSSNEDVHHKDENKDNDTIENLEVLTKSAHAALHQTKPSLPVTCSWCGGTFYIKPYVFRHRTKQSVTKRLYCSRQCTYNSQRK